MFKPFHATGCNISDINDVELAGYALTMFVEGYETSSSVLGFAIYEMARNPDIQDRLYEEITDVLAKYDGKFTFEALQEMEYLDNVIQETMRLNVVAPLISRVCTKEYTLPPIDGQKEPVTIQPGTPVQICVRALHMYVFILTCFLFQWEVFAMSMSLCRLGEDFQIHL